MITRKFLSLVMAIVTIVLTNTNAQTLPSNVPTNGLVCYWGFNGNANDQSGNGNNGIVNGVTLTADRNGNVNSAYSFNGISSYVSIPNSAMTGNGARSICAWIKSSSVVPNCIISTGDFNINSADFNFVMGYGQPGIIGVMGFNNDFYPNTGVSINNNNWHFVSITYDGYGNLKTYVDGLLDNSCTKTYNTSGQINYIGKSNDTNNEGANQAFFNGIIDDLGIWNRALSQSEITQLYTTIYNVQNLCTKTIQPYNVNVGDVTHEGSTYVWSLSPEAPNVIINGNGTNAITMDWTNVPDGSYTLQAIETSITGCISNAVTATINLSVTPAPIALPQTFCSASTVAHLVALGNNLQWYTSPTAGYTLDNNTILSSGTYYVSQIIGTCESTRTPVSVIVTPIITPTFLPIPSTCSGTTINPLPTTSTNGIVGTWSPALNNSQTTTYTFTPNDGQCASTTTQNITITTPKVTSPISFVAPPEQAAILPSVTIGSQIWTRKNLDVAVYRDGTLIPQVTDPNQWANLTTGAWCYYNNDPANGEVYGKLYNWYAVNDPRGLAPVGFHVPSDAEWTILTDFLGGEEIAGGKLKEIGLLHWVTPNLEATNSTGFSGLPGGYRNFRGEFLNLGISTHFWSKTEPAEPGAWFRFLTYYQHNAYRYFDNKSSSFSVRLIKD